jgi:hypothetical protein
VQSHCYGREIPAIYGSMKVAGNIIWSIPLSEKTLKQAHKKNIHTSYYYTLTCAIALCQGPIDEISRIWINDKLVDLNFSNYRFYRGSQEQMPDHLIESYEGKGQTPAYRGIAYLVIEDFSLQEFSNHIPTFTFEVKRKIKDNDCLEDMIKNMVIILASGEFVYDPDIIYKIYGMALPNGQWAQNGPQLRINHNSYHQKADAVVALAQLTPTCQNLEWVAPTVAWFVDDLARHRI